MTTRFAHDPDLFVRFPMLRAGMLQVEGLGRIAADLSANHATGKELFATLGGAIEHPDHGEVIFRDAAGVAHARRWVHRQGAVAAVCSGTRRALLVAEAMHDGAEADLREMVGSLAAGLERAGCWVTASAEWEAGP
ncbi:MAG: hypothetical protein ACK40I_01205 [Tabrizicola sp.]